MFFAMKSKYWSDKNSMNAVEFYWEDFTIKETLTQINKIFRR